MTPPRVEPFAALVALLLGASASPAAAGLDPPAPTAPAMVAGDTWVFDTATERGTSNFASQRLIYRIERVGGDDMVVGVKQDGSPVDFEDHVVGLDWSRRRIVEGEEVVAGRPFIFPLSAGKSWTIDFVDPTRHGLQASADHHKTYKVVGWEDVSTPAGPFHALRIESDDKIKAHFVAANGVVAGGLATTDGSTVVAHADRSGPRIVYGVSKETFFYVPTIKYWVKMVEEDYNEENVRTRRETDVLVSFKSGANG